jgi:predicted RNA-binding Zn ribbon-like protein
MKVTCYLREAGYTQVVHSHHIVPEYQFDLSGGVLCLDFANTVSRRKLPQHATDHIDSYHDLVAFAEQSKVVSLEHAAELRLQARRRRREEQTSLRTAISYRESLYRVFSALAQGTAVPPGDLQQINHLALRAMVHRRLVRVDDGYRWEWNPNARLMLDRILWPIALSATQLLTSSQLSTVRMCEAPDCAWLFLDQSRNRSRRWCDMKVCGNRQKARRHYQRAHG